MASTRETALSIWNAAVDSVRAESLIADNLVLHQHQLSICRQESVNLAKVRKICVVGAGKASGYLAAEFEKRLESAGTQLNLEGWVNVPENGMPDTRHVYLHAGRPAGVNEPTVSGVHGTREMLRLVGALNHDDVCFCLISGGGSALLPLPVEGITLDDKLAVTRLMSANGASIQELNRIRIALSAVKGGGLSRACRAGKLITLIVSDVIGDPLDLIASGPTINPSSTKRQLRSLLERYANHDDISARVWERLELLDSRTVVPPVGHQNASTYVIANNAYAVQAAKKKAESLGLDVHVLQPESPDTTANTVANQLMERIAACKWARPTCWIWGGEPTVKLAPPERRGKGGRNQQLVLGAHSAWEKLPKRIRERLCIVSGGTDGEDGPTDAAGGLVDQATVSCAADLGFDVVEFLERNDAYTMLDRIGALIRTGPTRTNVCDIRVAVLD